jgi:lysophosphatidylcholine acyltransferase/lyso-PAF acetyltransferase
MDENAKEQLFKNNGNQNYPFRVRLQFSIMDWIKMIIVGLTLVPIRIISTFLVLVIAWIVASIGLIGMDRSKPVTGWRKPLQKFVGLLGRAYLFCIGVHYVKQTGRQCSKDEAPVLVVAPHSSFFDALAIFCTGFSYFVNREENKSIPLIGKCIEFNQAIFVSREDPKSRQRAKEEISQRTRSKDPWSQFVIYPEGATSNRRAVLRFKPGGFIPGVTVQPVLMKYPNHHDTISWTWDQPHGVALCILYTVCQLHVYAEIEFLPPYTPSEEEKKDPQLFADNVRKVMADAAGVPLCEMSYEQVKARYTKNKKA